MIHTDGKHYIPFRSGKHKGKCVKQVPSIDLKLAHRTAKDLGPVLKYEIEVELKARGDWNLKTGQRKKKATVGFDASGVILFGKHKGSHVTVIPSGYLHWLVDSSNILGDADYRLVTCELNRRELSDDLVEEFAELDEKFFSATI